MAADLDALLNRMLADADGKEDPATAPVGGGTVYTGPSSLIRNIQDLVAQLRAGEQTADWDPKDTFTDPDHPIWIWRADGAVTDQNNVVTSWPAYLHPFDRGAESRRPAQHSVRSVLVRRRAAEHAAVQHDRLHRHGGRRQEGADQRRASSAHAMDEARGRPVAGSSGGRRASPTALCGHQKGDLL